jgi:hypothetical protein
VSGSRITSQSIGQISCAKVLADQEQKRIPKGKSRMAREAPEQSALRRSVPRQRLGTPLQRPRRRSGDAGAQAARPRRRSSLRRPCQGVRRKPLRGRAAAACRRQRTGEAALHPTVQLRADRRGNRGKAADDRAATIARSPCPLSQITRQSVSISIGRPVRFSREATPFYGLRHCRSAPTQL